MELAGLLTLILVIALIGLCVWLIENYIPMDNAFKIAIRVIVIIVLVLWIINRFIGPLNLR